MTRNSTLRICFIALISLISVSIYGQNNGNGNGNGYAYGHIHNNQGNSNNYNLADGDSLYIATGVFTGRIESFGPDARITIAAGAVFQPSQFENPRGMVRVYGTVKFNNWVSTNSGFKLNNYGTVWFAQGVQMNNGNQTWNNNFGGLLKFDGGFTNNGGYMLNKGTITAGGNVTLNNGATLLNKQQVIITGSYTSNSAILTNEALFQTSGSMTFNGGTVANSCRMITAGGMTNNNGTISNGGLIWAKSSNHSGNITNNSGSIINGSTANVKAVNFTNYGSITGSGYYYFTGTTTGSGTIGKFGNTTDTIRVYDASRSNPSTIFDNQWGSIAPNVIYSVLNAPDTVNNFIGCSSELMSNIPLPVKWNAFFVNLTNNVPVLNWEAEQDPGTIYEIQRSYDGSNYIALQNVAAEMNKMNYTFNDAHVNTQSTVVYYRIRAIEPNGSQVYSAVRTVKFSNKTGITIQSVPNPFTSQFSINYHTTTRETLTIRVFSVSGQLQVAKTASVNNGFNSITVTEAASLAKGMYMVQISNGTTVIATEKMIKQ